MFDGVVEGLENVVRNMWWGIIDSLLGLINGMFEALFSGVLQFAMFDNSYVQDAFKTLLLIFFIVIVPKVSYEFVMAMLKDDYNNLSISKKVKDIVHACFMAMSVMFTVPIANSFCTVVMKMIAVGDKTKGIADNLSLAIFNAFGGMSNTKASELISNYRKSGFDITERIDGSYKYGFSEILVIIGLAIFLFLVVQILLQVSLRVCFIGFLFIIAPMCCLGLTKGTDSQPYTVWKNGLISQYINNITQIFLLMLVCMILPDIQDAANAAGNGLAGAITSIVLWFGAFGLISAVPPYISSMIGGYGLGVMDTMNQMKQGLGIVKASTVGVGAMLIGKRDNVTGERSGGAYQRMFGVKKGGQGGSGFRTGGFAQSLMGVKTGDGSGGRTGGVAQAVMGTRQEEGQPGRVGGLNSAIFGDRTDSSDGTFTRSGGLRGVFRGTTIRNSDGSFRSRTGSSPTRMMKKAKDLRDNADISSDAIKKAIKRRL